MAHAVYNDPPRRRPATRLGELRLHGTGPIEAFVIIEPELRQLFIEAELARDASAWFFCCIGIFAGAICSLLTLASTEQTFNWRHSVLATLATASAIVALKMYGTWRKHTVGYSTLLQSLRSREAP